MAKPRNLLAQLQTMQYSHTNYIFEELADETVLYRLDFFNCSIAIAAGGAATMARNPKAYRNVGRMVAEIFSGALAIANTMQFDLAAQCTLLPDTASIPLTPGERSELLRLFCTEVTGITTALAAYANKSVLCMKPEYLTPHVAPLVVQLAQACIDIAPVLGLNLATALYELHQQELAEHRQDEGLD